MYCRVILLNFKLNFIEPKVQSAFCPYCWRASPLLWQDLYPDTQIERQANTVEYQGARASEEAVLGIQVVTAKLNSTSFCTGAEDAAQTSWCHSKYPTILTACFPQELWINAARQKKEPESPGQGIPVNGQGISKINSETLRISSHSAKMAGHYTLFGNRAMPIMEKCMTNLCIQCNLLCENYSLKWRKYTYFLYSVTGKLNLHCEVSSFYAMTEFWPLYVKTSQQSKLP